MSGEPGTEPEVTELEDLQAQIEELESSSETYQDDLADMTQRKDALAEALEKAIDDLDDLRDNINTTDARATLNENS